ncbi:hypothetical protein Syun_002846 [Stephania yunnanensis]|uniref:Uncharacterized protein n=1 Tax=Stephania yunnanensis TaxID=152371 RepID=A0AAP0L234_9MAGN
MVVNAKPPSKRLMKRVSADLHDFMKFPDVETEVPDRRLRGFFRGNVRSFLTKHGRYPAPCSLFPHLMVWQVLLRIGDLVDDKDGSSPAVVTLDIIEEDVTKSRSIYCDQCRVIAIQLMGIRGRVPDAVTCFKSQIIGEDLCFIITSAAFGIQLLFVNPFVSPFSLAVILHELMCKSCEYAATSDDIDLWLRQRIEDTTHLLHGVVHMNGYGHLLRVNGKEGGSKFLSGCDIMNFWDRLCNTLGVRKISVMDISKKYGLDYRILHAVTNGHPWYGDWGFEFGAGSFALTLDAYKQAIDTLSNMQLSHFFEARGPRTKLQDVINFYQSLSEYKLSTLKDLFVFLMKLIPVAHKSSNFGICKLDSSSLAICPWTRNDIERVEQSIIKVLLAVGSSCWVSWRALKGTLHKVASAELIDHCLRELGGKSVPSGTVISRCNASTNSMEYRLDSSKSIAGHGGSAIFSCNRPSEFHLLQDLKFLYDSLLNPHTMVNYMSTAARELLVSAAMKLLDCKQFVKEYKFVHGAGGDGSVLRFLVNLELSDQPKDFTFPPPELVILPPNATLADFKIEAAKAFQEVYVLFKRLVVDEVVGFAKFGDRQAKLLFGSDAAIDVLGRYDVPESVICASCSDGLVTVRKKKRRVEGGSGDGGNNKPSKKKGRSKSSKICQVRASNVVYLHSKASSSVLGMGEMDCVDAVLDTCSSEKFGSYGTEMGVPEKCLKGFEQNIDKESKDETTSDLDTSTVTLSDNFEDTFSLLDTYFLEEPSN